jgi:hypothetical protein
MSASAFSEKKDDAMYAVVANSNRESHSGVHRASGFIVVAMFAALFFPSVSRADATTRLDGRDTRGPLDIVSVGHRHDGHGDLVHAVRTSRPFSSRLLSNGNGVLLAFDTNGDAKPDRLATVFWIRGALRGAVVDGRGRAIEPLGVSRPDSRTIAIRVTASSLGFPIQYRWLAVTTFRGKPGCNKACIDIAPNRTMILHRIAELFTLSVSVTGNGRVRSGVVGIDCPSACSQRFRERTLVRLDAVPAEGWVFTGWSGACTGMDACTVTMDSAKFATATFAPLHVLTVSTGGSPGEVAVNPPGVPCNVGPCTYRFIGGTTVVLTAQPSPWQVFAGWAGACVGASPTCVVAMNAPASVTAYFSPKPFMVSIALAVRGGASGRVVSDPAGIDCPGECSASYPSGISVRLTATPSPGSTFAGWNGSSVRDRSILLIIGQPYPQDQTISAAFEPDG